MPFKLHEAITLSYVKLSGIPPRLFKLTVDLIKRI